MGLGMLGAVSIAAIAQPAANAQTPLNPEIEVGVVQRFGEEATDILEIEALAGDRLTLSFDTGGQSQSLTATKVTFDVVPEALPGPALQERLVLSQHRSFESAEDSAKQWQKVGLETEIAQPGNWEVWAKRSVYNTPLLRRLLLQSLHEQGYTDTFLDSQVVGQTPKAAFVVNGYRYHRDQVTITSGQQRIRVTYADARPATRVYGGDLKLQPNTYGTYTLVNEVPIETYLRGVVPHEIGAGAPRTTIEAQAILARTYALRNLRRFAIDDYQLCADTQCQVYWGVGGATAVTDQAIAATRGLVLTYQNELVDALYSSTTGGVTAPFSDVWNGPDRPYLKSVVDSVQGSWDLALRPLSNEQNLRAFLALDKGFNEVGWDLFRWRYESDLTEISQDLKAYLSKRQSPLAGFSQVLDLAVTQRADSGRVQVVTVKTDMGDVNLVKDEIVRVLSAPRSLLFYVDPVYAPANKASDDQSVTASPTDKELADKQAAAKAAALEMKGTVADTAPAPPAPLAPTPNAPALKGYTFVGGGWGHGVGMSQTGAYRLGDLGWASDRILNFYYPGTTLQPISDDLTFWRDPDPVTPATAASTDAAADPTE